MLRVSRPTASYLVCSLTALALALAATAQAGTAKSLFRGAQTPVGFAVDAQGGIHAAWIASDGVHYSTVVNGKKTDTLFLVAPGSPDAWVSLALDSAGLPHVALGPGALSYAHFDGSTWSLASLGPGGFGVAIAVDADDRPHIAHALEDGTFEYLHLDDTGWESETPDGITAALDTPLSLALDSAGHAHVGLADAATHHPIHATNATGEWTTEELADSPCSSASVAVDSLGLPHAALALTGSSTIRYRAFDGATWSTEDLYDPNALGVANQPAGAALALDAHDRPEIVFTTRLGGAPTAAAFHVYRDGVEWRGGPLVGKKALGPVAIAFDPNGVACAEFALAAKGGMGLAKYESIALPDLTGAWTSLDTVVTNGVAHFTGTLQITNAGPGKSRAAKLGFVLSDDALVDPNDLVIFAHASVGALAPGASRTVKIAVGARAAVAGKHLIAVIDPTGVHDDLDRLNNAIDGPLGD